MDCIELHKTEKRILVVVSCVIGAIKGFLIDSLSNSYVPVFLI